MIAFDIEPLARLKWLELSIDILILLSIIIRFFTAQKYDNAWIYGKREIAYNFIVKGSFFLDVLSCLPSLISDESVDSLYYFKVLRFLKIEKLLKEIDKISSIGFS